MARSEYGIILDEVPDNRASVCDVVNADDDGFTPDEIEARDKRVAAAQRQQNAEYQAAICAAERITSIEALDELLVS